MFALPWKPRSGHRLGRAAVAAGALAILSALVLGPGCGTTGLAQVGRPARPFDAVIIPGCPVETDGSLSRCLLARVVWGAVLWERGVTDRFIVSGAAVHSQFVEAEALAAGMAALGVPADRIWLEPEALHTDENMYDSVMVARALGLRSLAVASNGGHAQVGCRFLLDWGQPCSALPVEFGPIKERHRLAGDVLERLRFRRVPDSEYVPLAERERARAQAAGRRPRPASFWLYAALGIMKSNGEPWVPFAPAHPTLRTWADALRDEQASASRNPR